MPPGIRPAPPQQASLSEFWKKGKGKHTAAKVEKTEDKMDVDIEAPPKPRKSASPKAKRKADDTPVNGDAPTKAATKKRRVVESDDEEQAPATSPDGRAADAPDSPAKGMKQTVLAPVSKRGKKAAAISDEEDDAAPVKPATKRGRKVAAAVSDEDEDAAPVKAAAKRGKKAAKPIVEDESEPEANGKEARPVADENGEDEVDVDSEVEAAEVSKVAAKNAETAMSKLGEVDVHPWPAGKPVPYAAMAHVFSLIEATTKRLEKTALLTCFLMLVIQRSDKGDTQTLLESVYLCINRLCPDYLGIELGIGESLLIKAIAESTGRSLAALKADLKKEGDLGLVAMNSKNSQKTIFKPKPLTVRSVFKDLKEIAMVSGNSSQAKKTGIITKLLAACKDEEAKYIIRSLEGKLRIGNAERSVLISLANAVVLAEKEKAQKKWSKEKLASRLEEASNIVKQVYSELPSYDEVVPALLEVGIDGLKARCKLTPGVPLKPMLAKPTKAISEVLDRFEGKRFTCEYKYDGERAQVHRLEDGTVRVFSRNSEDMSKKYPDLIEQLPNCFTDKTTSFVFDAEAVAVDRTTSKLMPFQELSKRKRKDVKIEDIQVRVSLFAFDLLYLNGEPLLHKTLEERRELLRKHFKVVPNEFDFAKASDGETTDEIQTFLDESIKDGCEGLMVKMLQSDASYYEPSRRSVNWLKLKKDYLAGMGDSLDLVVVGGYHGMGKRTNVYGAFLLAVYDSDAEEYQTICKIGTGFSDEALATHFAALQPLEISTCRGDVKAGGANPDVWFEPKIVWEVLAADLSLSPIYAAAQGLVDQRGISLRFPRFIRIRDDKDASAATGPEQVAEMYERQALAQSKPSKKGGADDDFW